MPKKLSFWEIIKFIHPDLNKDVINSEKKLDDIILNRFNEENLFLLAVEWGFVNNKEFEYNLGPGKIVKIDNKSEGIIIEVTKNNVSGNDVVVHLDNSFITYKRKEQNENFYVTGYAPDNLYSKLDFKWLKTKV
jgi:hypothetical protein